MPLYNPSSGGPPSGTAGGDLSGTYPNPGVAQIQGVAVTSTEATLVSDLNNATSRSATATLLPGEETIFTGSTAGQTLTLPASPPGSSINSITNASTVSVTLAPGAGATLSNFGTTGNITIPSGYNYTVVYISSGTVWDVEVAGPSDFAKNNALAIVNGGTGQTGAPTAGQFLGAASSTASTWFPAPYDTDTAADHGMVECNLPSNIPPSANAFVSGTIYGTLIVARTNKTISKFCYHCSVLAGTPTAGENLAGLYSVSGTTFTQVAVTGDLTTWGPTNQLSMVNFGGPVVLTAGASYAVLMLSVASSAVTLRGISAATYQYLNNGCSNSAAPWYKFFTLGTGQTALPSTFASSSMAIGSTVLAPLTGLA